MTKPRRLSRATQTAGARLADLGAALRSGAVFILLAALLIGFSTAEPAFANLGNLMSILQAVAVVAILGAGVTVTLAVGGFDLSIGAIAASSVMAASYAMIVWGLDTFATVPLGSRLRSADRSRQRLPDRPAARSRSAGDFVDDVFCSPACSSSRPPAARFPPGLILPDGTTATGAYDPAFLLIGRSSLFAIVPVSVVLMALVAVALFVLTERTRIGRLLFATGGNEVATRLAGASTARLKTLAYVISGTLASLGGIVIAARVGRGDVSSGGSLLMDAVAARADRLCGPWKAAAECARHHRRRRFRRRSAQRPDHAQCALLHARLRQGRRPRRCPGANLWHGAQHLVLTLSAAGISRSGGLPGQVFRPPRHLWKFLPRLWQQCTYSIDII